MADKFDDSTFDMGKILEIPEYKKLWPKRGDKALVASIDQDKNAYIEQISSTRLLAMIMGYKESADILIHKAEEKENKRNTLIYPILFNYRQFIELSLKYILGHYGHHFGVEQNWRSHDLKKLVKSYFCILEKVGDGHPDEADIAVKEIILEFAKIDSNSYSFRYPLDTKGKVIEISMSDVFLPMLAESMQKLENYFDGCDGYLDNASQYVNEGNGEY